MRQPDSVKRPRVINSYDGYRPSKENEVTREVDPNTLSVKEFWNSFIIRREPCVLRGLCNKDLDFKALKKWTENANYLKEAAGDENVSVERRDKGRRYGLGREELLSFGALVDAIQDGDDTLYLTAQDLPETDFTGRPDIIPPPLRSEKLKSDLTLRPRLLGGLIPQSISLWLGVSKDPATSGLHVDFHDNLYVLLKGRKVFTLFSPSHAENMYTHGKLLKVHRNGRINFQGYETEADGRHPQAERAVLAAEALNRAVATVSSKDQDDDAIEKAMEEVLDAECDVSETYSDSSDGIENDNGTVARRKFCSDTSTTQPQGQMPDNFSQIDDLANIDTTKFSLFNGTPYSVAELRAEDVLYLPCGWFHNVTSCGDGNSMFDENAEDKNADVITDIQPTTASSNWHPDAHISLNIWYHPPDGKEIDKPYISEFWENDWTERCTNPNGIQ